MANVMTVSKFMMKLASWFSLVAGLLAVVLPLLELWTSRKSAAALARSQYGYEAIDETALLASEPFQAYGENAAALKTTPGNMRNAVLLANRAAQRRTITATGTPGLFREGADRQYHYMAARTFEAAFVEELTKLIPALGDAGTQTEKVNKAMDLLKGTLIQVAGASGVVEAQFATKVDSEIKRASEEFAKAWTGKEKYMGSPFALGPLIRNMPGMELESQKSVSASGMAYNKTFREMVERERARRANREYVPTTSLQRQQDMASILNGISPGLGTSMQGLAVDLGKGQQAFLRAVDEFGNSTTTAGQALDAVTRAAFDLEMATQGLTGEAKKKATARVQGNLAALDQQTERRIALQFGFSNFEDAVREAGGVSTKDGTGGAAYRRAYQDSYTRSLARLKQRLQGVESPMAAELMASMEATGPAAVKNRPAYMAAVRQKGMGSFRDRILEALIQYSAQREENFGMRNLGGIAGFDFAEAQRGSARSLVQNIERAIAMTKGDVIKAGQAIWSRQALGSSMGSTAEAIDVVYGPDERMRITKSVAEAAIAGEGMSRDRLLEAFEGAKLAASAVKDDRAIFASLPAELQEQLTNLVKGGTEFDLATQAGQAGATAWFNNFLTTLGKIREFGRQTMADAEREFYAREGSLRAMEHQQQAAVALLEAEQKRAQYYRDAGIARADIAGPGRAFAAQYGDASARGREDVARIARDAENERAMLQARFGYGLIGQAQLEYELQQSRNNEQRKTLVAQETANLAAERVLLDSQIAIERDRVQSARGMLQGATAGLRGTLAMPWSEAFKGSRTDVVERMFRPTFDTLAHKLSDNFVDSWFGADGIFGSKLTKMFSVDVLMDREILIREQYLLQLQSAVQMEQRQKEFSSSVDASFPAFGTGANYTAAMQGVGTGALVAGGALAFNAGSLFGGPAGVGTNLGYTGSLGTFGTGVTTGGGIRLVGGGTMTATDLRAERRRMMKEQAMTMLAMQAGGFLAGGLNSGRGMFGMRFGADKGNNYASEGSNIGGMVGSAFGPWGALAGSFLGGMLGGWAGKGRQHETPEAVTLEAIERNTRETVSVLENQTKLLAFDNRLIGVPTSFRYPSYPVVSGGGSQIMQQENHYSIVVQGSGDPQATAQAVVSLIKSDRRGQGNFSSRRR